MCLRGKGGRGTWRCGLHLQRLTSARAGYRVCGVWPSTDIEAERVARMAVGV